MLELNFQWVNPIINKNDFMEDWLINCALDACALSHNNPQCPAFGPEFGFARYVAKDIALAGYTSQDITDFPTHDPTAQPTNSPTDVPTQDPTAHMMLKKSRKMKQKMISKKP
eukprot:788943_1